jgi:hypothetical protein
VEGKAGLRIAYSNQKSLFWKTIKSNGWVSANKIWFHGLHSPVPKSKVNKKGLVLKFGLNKIRL